MDRRLMLLLATTALCIGATGYALAQGRTFGELFTDRFPGQTFPATGADLVDASAVVRSVRYPG